MIKKEIDIPIYNAKLVVIFTDDLPSVMAEYADEPCDHDVAITVHFESPLSYVTGFDVNRVCHMVVSHEMIHVTHRIMNDVALNHSFINDEAEAYLHGYIINEVYKVIKKNKLMCYGN